MAADILIGFILAGLRILSAIILSAGALYSGISMLDRLTPGIDEWKLIKKGNLAVGLFYASVMLAVFLFTGPRVMDFTMYIQSVLPIELTAYALVISFVNYLLSLLLGIFVIFLTIHVVDRVTYDLDEFAELQKGNVAVALIMSVVLIAVVLAVNAPFESLFEMIKSAESIL
jgi:uncharacterized membrane protein YjfL (UPF0719 family)